MKSLPPAPPHFYLGYLGMWLCFNGYSLQNKAVIHVNTCVGFICQLWPYVHKQQSKEMENLPYSQPITSATCNPLTHWSLPCQMHDNIHNDTDFSYWPLTLAAIQEEDGYVYMQISTCVCIPWSNGIVWYLQKWRRGNTHRQDKYLRGISQMN